MMKIKSIPGGRIGNFLAGAAAASVVSGVAFAVTSPNFTYTATQTGNLSLGAMAMAPNDSFSANEYTFSPSGINTTSTTGACFVTGVNLPAGAVLRNLTVYFSSDNKGDLEVKFFRTRLTTHAYNPIIDKKPVENSDASVAITYPIPAGLSAISNADYSYGLRVCLSVGTFYSGARIQYNYKTAGD
jgi:hypothetical protein